MLYNLMVKKVQQLLGKTVGKYFFKWFLASLLMPIIVALVGIMPNLWTVVHQSMAIQHLALFFWPSSILLMSLGANEQSISDAIHVWGIAVVINICLYLLIGLACLTIYRIAIRSRAP